MRWGGIFDVDRKRIQLEEEELRTQVPNFWDDPKKAEEQLKKNASLKSWITAFDAIYSSIEDLQVIATYQKEGEATEEDLQTQ